MTESEPPVRRAAAGRHDGSKRDEAGPLQSLFHELSVASTNASSPAGSASEGATGGAGAYSATNGGLSPSANGLPFAPRAGGVL